jgi:hypothetical protein
LKKKKTKKDQLSLSSCINLTGAKSVARTTHDSMSDKNRDEARDEINKTLKTKINKEVKNALLDIAHREKLDLLNCAHLTKSVSPASAMVHPLKKTLEQLVGTHHAIKVQELKPKINHLVFMFLVMYDYILDWRLGRSCV